MKNKLLLPRQSKIIGIILFILSIANNWAYQEKRFRIPLLCKETIEKIGLGTRDTVYYDYTERVDWALIFLSLAMVAFSKQKREDEYVQHLRLKSLSISLYIDLLMLIILILNNFFLFDPFSDWGIALYTPIPLLLIFIVLFHFNLYRQKINRPETL